VSWKVNDYECTRCERVFELTTKSAPERVVCPSLVFNGAVFVLCAGLANRVISPVRVKTIVKGNHDFSEREHERLKKRSDEHWKRKGRDEGRDREQSLMAKYAKQGEAG
jgi:hypothetical protein